MHENNLNNNCNCDIDSVIQHVFKIVLLFEHFLINKNK